MYYVVLAKINSWSVHWSFVVISVIYFVRYKGGGLCLFELEKMLGLFLPQQPSAGLIYSAAFLPMNCIVILLYYTKAATYSMLQYSMQMLMQMSKSFIGYVVTFLHVSIVFRNFMFS